jgi:xylulokinase
MRRDLLIGCDIGTSAAKSVVTDDRGQILADARRDYGVITLRNQWAEQWPSVWLDAAIETIAKATADVDVSRIAGLCISALYGGTGVLCDEDMEPLRPAIIWMDRRAEAEKIWIENHIGVDRIFDVTKNSVDTYFGFTKLLWVKLHEPEIWEKVKMILPVHSYIIYKMTGQISIDYSSAGNIGGFYNYAQHNWDRDMCESLGIPRNVLPQRFGIPYETAGTLNREYSQKMNLPEGIPLCFGTVDCISSMLGAGMFEEGDNVAILGTSLNWGFITSEEPSDRNLISMPYCVDPSNMNYIYGGASTAGALPRWFLKNILGSETPEDYRRIETAIVEDAIPAGSCGLIALPYFMGERTPIWDENASGLFLGLSLIHRREHLFRAILESTAFSLRHIMETTKNYENIKKIILVGGGAKSSLWQTIFADVTDKPIYTISNSVEAPIGDAFLAGINTGLVNKFEEIKNWVKFNAPIKPDERKQFIYSAYFDIYKNLYNRTKEVMKALKQITVQP